MFARSPVPGSFGIKTNVIIPWYITSQENMQFNSLLIVLLFIMFSPISSTILHDFIREKNDKWCYCFYYKYIFSCIQLVLLFSCLMFPFSPQSCAGNACLSIPRTLGKALTGLQEMHHSPDHQGDESLQGEIAPSRRERWAGKSCLGYSCTLCSRSRQGTSCWRTQHVPGSGTWSNQGPGSSSPSQMPCPGHRYLWDRAGIQP